MDYCNMICSPGRPWLNVGTPLDTAWWRGSCRSVPAVGKACRWKSLWTTCITKCLCTSFLDLCIVIDPPWRLPWIRWNSGHPERGNPYLEGLTVAGNWQIGWKRTMGRNGLPKCRYHVIVFFFLQLLKILACLLKALKLEVRLWWALLPWLASL